jgi:hypothetical protein
MTFLSLLFVGVLVGLVPWEWRVFFVGLAGAELSYPEVRFVVAAAEKLSLLAWELFLGLADSRRGSVLDILLLRGLESLEASAPEVDFLLLELSPLPSFLGLDGPGVASDCRFVGDVE